MTADNENERHVERAVDFSEAFQRARAVGLREFSWRRFRYHTRRADETNEEWMEKMKENESKFLSKFLGSVIRGVTE